MLIASSTKLQYAKKKYIIGPTEKEKFNNFENFKTKINLIILKI